MLLVTPHLLQDAVHKCTTPCSRYDVGNDGRLFYSGFSFKLVCKPTDTLQPFRKQLVATSEDCCVYTFTYEDFIDFYRSFPLYSILVRNFQNAVVVDDLHRRMRSDVHYDNFVAMCQPLPQKKCDELILWDLWHAQMIGTKWEDFE